MVPAHLDHAVGFEHVSAGEEVVADGAEGVEIAAPIVALSLLFRRSWRKVASKTAVDRADLERADRLGRELLAAMGARLQPNNGASAANPDQDTRGRAFTLFVRAYDACRQAATYLRWQQGDADELVPSLFGKTRPRRPAGDEDAPAASPPPAPSNGAAPATTPAPPAATEHGAPPGR